jgi:hypothetical protein
VNEHYFTSLTVAFVFERQADRLHATVAIRTSIAFGFVDMLGPQAPIAMIAIGSAHNHVINNDELLAVRATEPTAIVFSFPCLRPMLFMIKSTILIAFHLHPYKMKNQPTGWSNWIGR